MLDQIWLLSTALLWYKKVTFFFEVYFNKNVNKIEIYLTFKRKTSINLFKDLSI